MSTLAPGPAGLTAHVNAALALMLRDTRLILRRPSRIAATILTPALLWLFFASGFASSLASSDDASYSVSLASGSALLVVTFASIFGALGMIRDRESGYLQAVLVGPTPRPVVITARVLSGAVFASLQAIPLLIAAVTLGADAGPAGFAAAAGCTVLASIGLAGACTALAWHFDSIEGFHGIMAGVLMPAWLLSGAVFPPDADTGPLAWLIAVNPLAYAHRAVIGLLGVGDGPATLPIIITALFAGAGLAAAVAAARGDAKR